jgi:addiction module RelE/StbE family toxin
VAEVKWTPDARDDLVAIHDDIAHDAPSAATAFILRLLGSVVRLRDFPDSGRMVPEFQTESLRELIVGSYRVVYRLRGDNIEIIRVRHGARLLSSADLPFELL